MPDLFREGTLEMSQVPLPAPETLAMWGDCMVNRIAVIVCLALVVVEIPNILRVYPSLLRCIPLWKANVDVEHSMGTARTRNTITVVFALLLCVFADRWGIVAPSFKTALPEHLHLAVTAGIIAGALLSRSLLFLLSKFRNRRNEYNATLHNSLYNYLILLSSVMLVTVLLLLAISAADGAIRVVLLVESAFFALLYLIRKGQILASRFSSFATILYLCALEILPIGFLIFVCAL